MQRPTLVIRWILPLVLPAGCANFSVEPAVGPDAPGLHFFLPKPYVLFWWERQVTVKSGTVIQSVVPRFEVVYLPDRAQRYTVTQHAVLATGDFAYRLKDGWSLEAVNGAVDTVEFLDLLKDLGTTALEEAVPTAVAFPDIPDEHLPPPVLYELVWNDDRGTYEFCAVSLEGFAAPGAAGKPAP